MDKGGKGLDMCCFFSMKEVTLFDFCACFYISEEVTLKELEERPTNPVFRIKPSNCAAHAIISHRVLILNHHHRKKKISLPGLWHKIELLNGWLRRLRLGRFMDPGALQSLRLDLAYRSYSRCMRTACAQPLACHQHLDRSRTRQWKPCTSLPPGGEGYTRTSPRQEESMPSSVLLWILVIKWVILQTK